MPLCCDMVKSTRFAVAPELGHTVTASSRRSKSSSGSGHSGYFCWLNLQAAAAAASAAAAWCNCCLSSLAAVLHLQKSGTENSSMTGHVDAAAYWMLAVSCLPTVSWTLLPPPLLKQLLLRISMQLQGSEQGSVVQGLQTALCSPAMSTAVQ